MGRKLKVAARAIAAAVFVAFCVAHGVGLLAYLTLSYWLGSQNMSQVFQDMGKRPFWRMFGAGDVNFARYKVQVLFCTMVVVGAIVMTVLLRLRQRFPRFPLPPLCFLIVCLGTMVLQRGGQEIEWTVINFIWGPMLIAYILKTLILRFGGMDLYVRVIPAALGLIVSQAVMIVFWNIYHALAAPSNVTVFTGVFQ
jgi:hypothetical protein